MSLLHLSHFQTNTQHLSSVWDFVFATITSKILLLSSENTLYSFLP